MLLRSVLDISVTIALGEGIKKIMLFFLPFSQCNFTTRIAILHDTICQPPNLKHSHFLFKGLGKDSAHSGRKQDFGSQYGTARNGTSGLCACFLVLLSANEHIAFLVSAGNLQDPHSVVGSERKA